MNSTLRTALISAFIAAAFLGGCDEDKKTGKKPGEQATVAAELDQQVNDMLKAPGPANGVTYVGRLASGVVEGVVDMAKRDGAPSQANPANGSRGGHTTETLPAIAIHMTPAQGIIGKGTVTALLMNTDTAKVELVTFEGRMSTQPRDDGTIKVSVIKGSNAAGVDLRNCNFEGPQNSKPLTLADAEDCTEQVAAAIRARQTGTVAAK